MPGGGGGQEYREEAKWHVMLVYGGWGGRNPLIRFI